MANCTEIIANFLPINANFANAILKIQGADWQNRLTPPHSISPSLRPFVAPSVPPSVPPPVSPSVRSSVRLSVRPS